MSRSRCRRFTTNEVQEIVTNLTGDVLKPGFVYRPRRKIKVICHRCGDLYKSDWGNFTRAEHVVRKKDGGCRYVRPKRCPCRNSEPKRSLKAYTRDQIEETIYKWSGDYLDPQFDYESTKAPLSVICHICENNYTVWWGNFKNKGQRCYCTSGLKIREALLMPWTTVLTAVEGEGYKLLTTREEYEKYGGAASKLDLLCPVGHRSQISRNNFTSGTRCRYCIGKGKTRPRVYTSKTFVAKAQKTQGEGRFLYDRAVYISNVDQIEIGCSICNEYFFVRAGYHSNMNHRCPICKPRGSKGERQTEYYLKSVNLEFKTEQSVPELGRLRFDFYVPCYTLYIEYDGKQHFEIIPYWDGNTDDCLKKRIRHGDMKNDFCRGRYPMLRIKYDQNVEEEMEYFLCRLRSWYRLTSKIFKQRPNNTFSYENAAKRIIRMSEDMIEKVSEKRIDRWDRLARYILNMDPPAYSSQQKK